MTAVPTPTPSPVSPRTIRLENVRLAFCKGLFKPVPKFKGSPDNCFQAAILIPPGSPNLPKLAEAMKAAMLDQFKQLVQLKDKGQPVKDAGLQAYAGFAKGWYCINTQADRQPPVVNAAKLPITDPSQVWGGMWANVVVHAYGWGPNVGGRGVSFELKAVQIIREGAATDPDGARLDGRSKAVDPDQAFEALEMDASAGAAPGAAAPKAADPNAAPWSPF